MANLESSRLDTPNPNIINMGPDILNRGLGTLKISPGILDVGTLTTPISITWLTIRTSILQLPPSSVHSSTQTYVDRDSLVSTLFSFF